MVTEIFPNFFIRIDSQKLADYFHGHDFSIRQFGRKSTGSHFFNLPQQIFYQIRYTTINCDDKILNKHNAISPVLLGLFVFPYSEWHYAIFFNSKKVAHRVIYGTQGIMLVYDITSKESFRQVKSNIDRLRRHADFPKGAKIM